MSLFRRAALAAVAVLTAVIAFGTPATAQPSDQDAAWMVAAHQSNLAEIAAGQAAKQHATTDAVREMGDMLIADHRKLDADLTAAADRFGVDLPASPSPAQRAALEEVKAHQGAAFDTAWIASQIDGHEATVAATRKQIDAGQDETVLGLARAALPHVQGHLDALRRLAEEQGMPTAVPSGLGGPGTTAPVGAALLAVGLLTLAGSVVVLRRRRG